MRRGSYLSTCCLLCIRQRTRDKTTKKCRYGCGKTIVRDAASILKEVVTDHVVYQE